MNFFNKLASVQTKEGKGRTNIEQIEDMERNNTPILDSLTTFKRQRGALEENTERDNEMAKVCSSIDTKEANSNINSNDDYEYKNKSDPNDKMEITIGFDKIKFPKEENKLNNLNSIDDHINDQLDFETIIAVSQIKKDMNNIDEGINQFSSDLNVLNKIPNTNDLETIKTDLINSIVENSNNKNIIDFDNFEDLSVNFNRHDYDLASSALHNFNTNIIRNGTTVKEDFILDFTGIKEIKEFENILDNYQQELNTNDTFITNGKYTRESHEVFQILQSTDHNMSYKYKDEVEIKKLSKSNATGDAISPVYSVSSNETDNGKKLSRELSNASIISISSTEVDLSDTIEATTRRNEIKKDILIENENYSESDGYHSSDFEFITESDAEKDGLFNKKQKHVNATKNSKVRTVEFNVDSDSNKFAGPSTSKGNFNKTRHAPSSTVTAETANNDFKAEDNHNNNVGPSTSKGNFNKSHVKSATDARSPTGTANNHSKAYYNDLKMQYLMKESANRRETHSIPQGEDYFNLFREVGIPIWIDMENKYVTPPKCMALGQQDIGFGRGIHRLNSEERQFTKQADESLKKIFEMYPEENMKRRRRF